MKRTAIFIIVLLSTIPLAAQWKNVAPNLLSANRSNYGAMQFAGGILWAGGAGLWSSKDTGRTWSKNSFNFSPRITDVFFLDAFNGLVCTWNAGVYLTRDGGQSWKKIYSGGICFQAIFNGSPDIIHIVDETAGLLSSMDGGTTWKLKKNGDFVSNVTVDKSHRLYMFSVKNLPGLKSGWVCSTTDNGLTWSINSDSTQQDCYSFMVDSCDLNRWYLLNEDWASASDPDSRSELIISTDGGASWVTTASEASPYFSSAWAASKNAVYAGTSGGNGFYRSIDQGITWKKIGGPSVGWDTHAVTAINDNIIFALDVSGSIWATFNSGGDSLTSTSFDKLSISTEDRSTDTIGASVQIPIIINGIAAQTNFEIILRYDLSSDLRYTGSFSLDGVSLDKQGEQWNGRSKLHLQPSSDGLFGNAVFTVFADSPHQMKVWFDSISLLNAFSSCENSIQTPSVSIVTPPFGCGKSIISKFLQTSKIPSFFIYPNPNSGNFTVESSQAIKTDIMISDGLGRNCFETTLSFKKDEPTVIDVNSLPSGVYLVRFKTNTLVSSRTLIIQK